MSIEGFFVEAKLKCKSVKLRCAYKDFEGKRLGNFWLFAKMPTFRIKPHYHFLKRSCTN